MRGSEHLPKRLPARRSPLDVMQRQVANALAFEAKAAADEAEAEAVAA